MVLFQLDSFLVEVILLSEHDFQILREPFFCMKEFYLVLEAMKEN